MEQPIITSEESLVVDPNAPVPTPEMNGDAPVTNEADPTAAAAEPMEQPIQSSPVPTPSGVNVVNGDMKEEIKSQDAAMDVASMPTLVSEETKDDRKLNPYKSHWLTTFNFEGMEYKLPLDFEGTSKDFGDDSPMALYGARLGFGGELYLGGGLMTSSRVEGYYMGTAFTRERTAGPEVTDVKFGYTKDTGQIFGVDAVQTLSWLFDLKTKNPFLDEMTYLTLEPFVEAGIGIGRAFLKKRYHYDLTVQEDYEQSFADELANAKIGAGLQATSSSGFMLFMRVTQNRYEITKRKSKGYNHNGDINFSDDNADMDSITIYSIGGGYKF